MPPLSPCEQSSVGAPKEYITEETMAKVEFEDPIASLTGSMTLLRKHFHCMASLTCSFVNSSRGAVRRLDLGVPKIFLIFGGSVEQGGALYKGRARSRASLSLSVPNGFSIN